jgi:hypothetical protein
MRYALFCALCTRVFIPFRDFGELTAFIAHHATPHIRYLRNLQQRDPRTVLLLRDREGHEEPVPPSQFCKIPSKSRLATLETYRRYYLSHCQSNLHQSKSRSRRKVPSGDQRKARQHRGLRTSSGKS